MKALITFSTRRIPFVEKNFYLFCLALISVSAKQSPLITIASGGSPTRSEIRLSSAPNPNKSTLREIRISRPDSPSISINRTGTNQPITITSNANGGTITEGTGKAFRISVAAPTKRTSPVCQVILTRTKDDVFVQVFSSDGSAS